MKVIGIVGSHRKSGNTELLTKHTLKAISEEGLRTELIWWAIGSGTTCRQELHHGSTYLMVSDSRVLHCWFYVLECGHRQRKRRSGTG